MNLLIFNLKTDADDHVLGFTTDWVNGLARYYGKVVVVTMSAGRLSLEKNVHVYSVGLEKNRPKFIRFFVFYYLLWKVLKAYRFDACFAHMMPLFALMGWPLLRLKGVPILLWYAHRNIDWLAKSAHLIADRVVSTNSLGFSLKSSKAFFLGHGISEQKFSLAKTNSHSGELVLVSIARLSKIKNIHVMIKALEILVHQKKMPNIKLVLVGDAITDHDEQYLIDLKKMAIDLNLMQQVVFVGSVPHLEVSKWFREASFSINLTPGGAMDKAVLESLVSFVPVIFHNESFSSIYLDAGLDPSMYRLASVEPIELARKIESLQNCSQEKIAEHATIMSTYVRKNYGLDGMVKKIYQHLLEISKAMHR